MFGFKKKDMPSIKDLQKKIASLEKELEDWQDDKNWPKNPKDEEDGYFNMKSMKSPGKKSMLGLELVLCLFAIYCLISTLMGKHL